MLALQQGQLVLVQGGSEGVHGGQLRRRLHQRLQRFVRRPAADGGVDSAHSLQHCGGHQGLQDVAVPPFSPRGAQPGRN